MSQGCFFWHLDSSHSVSIPGLIPLSGIMPKPRKFFDMGTPEMYFLFNKNKEFFLHGST